jgi:diguanylate cyclase
MLSYRKEIFYPLLIAALMLSGSTTWLFVVMSQLLELSDRKDKVDVQRYHIIKLESSIIDAESGLRGYLLTGNTLFLEAFHSGRDNVKQAMSKEMFPENKSSMIKIRQLVEEKFKAMNQSLRIQLNAGSYAPHLNLAKDTGKAIMTEIKTHLNEIDSQLLKQRNDYTVEIETKIKEAILGGSISILIVLSIFVFTYHRTVDLFAKLIDNNIILDRLSYEAVHDQLTGMMNRRGFDNHLKLMYEYASLKGKQFAILYMDLNKFKQVNDTYGHNIGDALLIKVASILKNQLRAYDGLSRLGGDEFAVVVNKYASKQELVELVNRLKLSLDHPMLIEGNTVNVGISIGFAEFPYDARDLDKLIAVADEAMYQSKRSNNS